MKNPPCLSIVVPCHNEAAVLPIFHAALVSVLAAKPVVVEFIYVDDGSADDTWRVIGSLSAANPQVRGLKFSRNFGKEAAMYAGLEHAKGDAIVIMDADMQDSPEAVGRMLDVWRQGHVDVVHGVRASRMTDSWAKRIPAGLFHMIFQRVVDFPVRRDAGDFRLMSRKAVAAVLSLKERTRFSKGLFDWVGFRSATVEFDRQERAAGDSSWSTLQLVALALDGITSFSALPLRFATMVGSTLALGALGYGLLLVGHTLYNGARVPGYASIMAAILFLSGLQLIFLGIIGEYMGRIFSEAKHRPLYILDETTGPDMP